MVSDIYSAIFPF